MKPLPKDIAALLVTAPQLRPGAVKARVSALVAADQNILDMLRETSVKETPSFSKEPT